MRPPTSLPILLVDEGARRLALAHLEDALAAHLVNRKEGVSEEERDRLVKLIEEARKEGR